MISITRLHLSTTYSGVNRVLSHDNHVRPFTVGYSKVPKDMRDNFHVRAKYSHTKRSGIHNELLFEKGTIFHVLDTLPAKRRGKGMWLVNRLNCKG